MLTMGVHCSEHRVKQKGEIGDGAQDFPSWAPEKREEKTRLYGGGGRSFQTTIKAPEYSR